MRYFGFTNHLVTQIKTLGGVIYHIWINKWINYLDMGQMLVSSETCLIPMSF